MLPIFKAQNLTASKPKPILICEFRYKWFRTKFCSPILWPKERHQRSWLTRHDDSMSCQGNLRPAFYAQAICLNFPNYSLFFQFSENISQEFRWIMLFSIYHTMSCSCCTKGCAECMIWIIAGQGESGGSRGSEDPH